MLKIDNPHDYRGDYNNLRGLIDLILSLPRDWCGTPMIEVGSNTGDSAQLFSLFFSPVVCVDIFEDDTTMHRTGDEVMKLFLEKTKNMEVFLTRSTSYQAAIYPKFDLLPESVWFAYIDASHYHDAVMQDIKNIWPRVKVGGAIAGHDYGCLRNDLKGVTSAVNLLFGSPDFTFIDGSWLVQKRSEDRITF